MIHYATSSRFFRHRQVQVSALAAAAATLSAQYYFWCTNSNESSYITQSEAPNTKDGEKEEILFENQCLERQLYRPKVPYPAWDYNWDGKESPETSLEGHRKGLHNTVKGKTRHIILVRHGQYDETYSEDEKRILTPLGRLQAIQTGKRLRELMGGSQWFPKEQFRGYCSVVNNHVRVSDMARAKETAHLIATEMGLSLAPPDPDLNETIPAPMIPIRPDIPGTTREIDEHGERVERAFQRYFYRDVAGTAPTATETSTNDPESKKDGDQGRQEEEEDEEEHEFEIIVCHGEFVY